MKADRSVGFFGLCAVLVASSALLAGNAGAEPGDGLPHHRQMLALYVIDHRGLHPITDQALVEYARPFTKILGGCTIGVDRLMMVTLNLANQASEVGGRNVTSLAMLKAIARRVVWKAPARACGDVYNLAEAHAENGDP